jgi:hypothetical protein
MIAALLQNLESLLCDAAQMMVQYVRFIYGYMGFAGFSIFFFLSGLIALQLIEKAQIRLDAISFIFYLYNFAVRSLRL